MQSEKTTTQCSVLDSYAVINYIFPMIVKRPRLIAGNLSITSNKLSSLSTKDSASTNNQVISRKCFFQFIPSKLSPLPQML